MEVITTHINADFDALASMLAAKKIYPNATLVFPGSQERSLRDFFVHSTLYVFQTERLKNIDMDKITRLILVDTRQLSRIGKFGQIIGRPGLDIHVYDHHPPSSDDIRGSLEVVREVGATVTLMLEVLEEKGVEINSDEATVLMLGLYEDTGGLTFSSVTSEDFHAAGHLRAIGASVNIISDMITRELTAEQVFLLNDLIRSATRYTIRGVSLVIAIASSDRYIGDIAVLVHKLKDMENLDVLFALVRMEDRIYLIGRSRIEKVNVGKLAAAFGGGGHPTAASATIKGMTLYETKEQLLRFLQEHIQPERRSKDLMTFPVKSIETHRTIFEAGELLTRYDINVLPVLEKERLVGLISRQVVEKASFHGLKDHSVWEYMTTEFATVTPETPLAQLQDIITGRRQRFVPVMNGEELVGAITRTDILRSFQRELTETEDVFSHQESKRLRDRKKMIAKLMEERLPKRIQTVLRSLGKVGDQTGCSVYAVGGFVRDLVMRGNNLDVDVVVEEDGIRFAREAARLFSCRLRIYKKFGTAVLTFSDGTKVDVATARLEYYDSPAALPTIEMSSIKRDLYRRDFTINTLAIRLNEVQFGELIDFFGALQDVKEKTIRVLHSLSFVEDPTRIFRAFRFEQRLDFQLGKHTQNLLRNAVKMGFLEKLSGGRIFAELLQILKENDPARVLKRLEEYGLLRIINPNLVFTQDRAILFERIRNILSWYRLLYLRERYDPWLVYLLGLFDDLSDRQVGTISKRLAVRGKNRRRIIEARRNGQQAFVILSQRRGGKKRPKRSEVYDILDPLPTEAKLFMMAKTEDEKIKRDISLYFTSLRNVKTALGGKNLIQMGFEPGPLFREIMAELLKGRLDGKIKSKEEEIDFVTRTYGPNLENGKSSNRSVDDAASPSS
ncbi:MAG: CBS domain-containing protein [Proteobacteria bacterium]|nr:CBS domain-containing protein [Pseudomonadota bacterium]NIS71840.1 CBS domain-containing protein [Pseudomonadota bacterium]